MSNFINRVLRVIVKLLNHFITASVFFHWFNFVPIIVLSFIVPIYRAYLLLVNLFNDDDLVGFMNLQLILFGKYTFSV